MTYQSDFTLLTELLEQIAVESCDPDNELQLITKVQVAPNNTNDNTMLREALPDLKERTGIETLYTDGPYAGQQID